MRTTSPMCEARETRCERRCEGQFPCRARLVKGVKGKLSHAYTRIEHKRAVTTHRKRVACTRALHTLHALHKSVVVRDCDVKGKTACLSRVSHMTDKPLRQAMPVVSGFIDALREVFGAPEINASIRAGMDGQPTFYARENGREIGTPMPSGGNSLSGADLLLNHKGGKHGRV